MKTQRRLWAKKLKGQLFTTKIVLGLLFLNSLLFSFRISYSFFKNWQELDQLINVSGKKNSLIPYPLFLDLMRGSLLVLLCITLLGIFIFGYLELKNTINTHDRKSLLGGLIRGIEAGVIGMIGLLFGHLFAGLILRWLKNFAAWQDAVVSFQPRQTFDLILLLVTVLIISFIPMILTNNERGEKNGRNDFIQSGQPTSIKF